MKLISVRHYFWDEDPGPSKVISFKLTQGQLNWLHALQSTMKSEDRSKALKKLIDTFFKHFDADFNFPLIINESLEQSILFDLLKDSEYSVMDLGLFVKSFNYDTPVSLSTTTMITIKFTPDYLAAFEKIIRSGLVMSRSEAIRFVLKFFIILLGRLANGGAGYD